MDELLIDYLFDQLPPDARRRVEEQLRSCPEARARLAALRAALAPLEDDDADPAPPPGLVEATLHAAAERGPALPPAPRPFRPQAGAAPRWARPIDWLAAAVLAVLVGGIGLPLLARARAEQQRLACSNNLRLYWLALQAYGARGAGELPRVETDGARSVAGVFVPALADAGLLPPDVSITCPAQGHRPPLAVTVAQLDRLYQSSPDEHSAVARELAPGYAYSLGYREGPSLRGLHTTSGDGAPVMADRAHPAYVGSANHAGRGQNVLFLGGHVRWCTLPTVGLENDHIYVNQEYRIRAGLNRVDAVLGPSDARPQPGE